MDDTVFHDNDDSGMNQQLDQLFTTPSERLVVVDNSRPSTSYYENTYCKESHTMFGGHQSAGYYNVRITLLFVRDVFTGQVFRIKTHDLTSFDP